MSTRQPVPRTRNGGQWTEAAYWGQIRSVLRRHFRFWKPAQIALQRARIRYTTKSSRQIWAYKCAVCSKFFQRQGVHIDHKEPVGVLTDLAHLPDFMRRLTPEDPDAFQINCLKCHDAKTAEERAARVNAKAGQLVLLQP